MPRAFARVASIGGLALAAVVALAIPAGAAITSPHAGTVSGSVTLSDDGTNSPGCSLNFGATTKNGTTNMYVDQGAGQTVTSTAPTSNVGSADTGTATIVNLGTAASTAATTPQSGSWNTDSWGNGTYTVNSVEVATKANQIFGLGSCAANGSLHPTVTMIVSNTGKISYGGAVTAPQNTSIPVSATLLDQNNVAPGAGQTISFALAGGSTVTALTNAAGTASTTLPINGAPRSTTLTVSYAGTYFTPATTGAMTFTVTQDPTTTTLSPTTSTDYGQTANFTATVASSVAGAITGSVQFLEDGNVVATQPVNGSGVANFSDATMAAGSHTIGAVYVGDSNFATSTATNATQVVVPAPTTTVVVTSVQPSVFGEAITYTATVTATSPGPATGAPSGTVSFSTTKSGGSSQPIGAAVPLTPSGTNVSTASSTAVSLLPAGSYVANASYAPCSPNPCAANFAGSESNVNQTISPAQTSVSVVSTLPVFSDFGQSVQFTATVTTGAPGHGPPTGTAHFVLDASSASPIDLGSVTLNPAGADASSATSPAISSLSPGLHSVTVTYTNVDGNFVSGTTGSTQQFVAPDPSTTVVSTVNNANPSVFGQGVAFQATVTLQFTDAGTPTGVVLFFLNDNNSASCASPPPADFEETLVNGVATTPVITSLPVGPNTITACYASTSSDFGASGTSNPQYVQTVNPDPTTTVLTSANTPGGASGPSVWGQPVTFTASVTANAPGAGIPPGTVTFNDGSNVLGTVALSGGTSSNTASLTTVALSVGTHAINAVYNVTGPDFLTSSAAINQTVNQDPTTTTLTQNDSSVQGQSVNFTATVTANAPGAGAPTGSVEFEINGADVFGGPVPLAPSDSGSTASSPSIAALTPGTYQVTAVYSGDVDFLPSNQAIGQIVNQSATTTTLVASPSTSPLTFGTPVALTATVAPTGAGTGVPTGSVDFYDGTTLLGSEPLGAVGGMQQATLPAAVYAIGTHSFHATYLGEFDYTGSTSNTVGQSVSAIGTTTALTSSLNPSLYTQVVTLTATVTPASNSGPGPGGTVTFRDGSTVIGTSPVVAYMGHFVATLSGPYFSVGTHNVTASYSGATDYNPSSSGNLAQVVNKDGTIVVAQASNNTTMTATLVTAQGAPIPGQTLSFTTGSTALCTAVTAANGVASCTATGLGAFQLVLNGTYTATYAGNASFLGSSASAKG